MTRENIEKKTSLCFLLNPNNSEEEKKCVIEKVMATKATIVSKPALCNIIIYMQKQNSKLEAQIEKMKCCQNCKFEDNDCIEEPCSVCTRCLGNLKRKGNSDKWEVKEND